MLHTPLYWRPRVAICRLNVSEGSSEWIMWDDFSCFSNWAEYSRIFFCCTAAHRGPWPPHSWGFYMRHNDAPQSLGLLWTSDQPVAETSTWQHTQHPQQTNIHAPGGIRTHNLSRRAAADPRLRPRGHCYRLYVILWRGGGGTYHTNCLG